MGSVKCYGDLDQKELRELLAEIESADDVMDEDIRASDASIAREEEQSEYSESPDNAEAEALCGEDAWRKPDVFDDNGNRMAVLNTEACKKKAIESRKKANEERARSLKAARLKIQREAFSQEDVPLSSSVGRQDLKDLLSALVSDHTQIIGKYHEFINKRLTALLRPFVPRPLKTCFTAYPASIRRSPGFMYTASEDYGEGLSFWATPDLPCYFEQGTEQEILRANKAAYLHSIDKAVALYHRQIKRRREKEVSYASRIMQKRIDTYFDLLKLNPFWFKTLYNLKINQKHE